MTAIQRNRAALPTSVQEGKLNSGGGDGSAPLSLGAGKVEKKVRYSHDPAAELMPAAEFLGHDPDFSAILEDFRDGPFDPRRRRVLGRLMGMFAMDYQGARTEERRFLRRLLAARNAREGYVANRALHLCGASHALRRTLALGVAESRLTRGPIGGFLGAVQARVAATTFLLLGPKSRERVWDLLTFAGRNAKGKQDPAADVVIERSLVLKAIGARRHRLGPWSADGTTALDEVQELAEALRGQPRHVLAARTTLLGCTPRTAAQPNDPTMSVGAIAAWRARGDMDPLFAWRQQTASPSKHAADVSDATAPTAADAARKDESTEAFDVLPELDRSPLLDRPRLHQAIAEARTHPNGLLTRLHCDSIGDYLAGKNLVETRQKAKDEALGIFKEQAFDVVELTRLESIRQDAQGIYRFDAARGLGLLLSRYTGAVYLRRVFSDQITAGANPLGQIALSLDHGLVVPFTVAETRLPVVRAWAALDCREEFGEQLLDLRRPEVDDNVALPSRELIALILPKDFGRRARADAYMAPAALDLLAPPFGIPFVSLGIEDVL